MAKVQNTFLKSKMNKDLDARLLPEGEYRDARNVQVSKSESDQVGNLENSLGNEAIADYTNLTGQTDIVCIGNFADELNNTVYLFFTNYLDGNPNVNNGGGEYEPTASNFIISTNILTNESTILVRGAFLNFSQTNLITGVNILENLLFFTDNRNQPRVINTILANPDPRNTNPTHYTIEDQISVAKYNPFEAIELYERSGANGITTMKDVSSLFLPNGGSATCIINSVPTTNQIHVDNIVGEINIGTGNAYAKASRVFVQDNLPGGDFTLTDTGETVTAVVGGSGTSFTITLTADVALSVGQKVVFNANPYFDPTFAGDPDYLEDKFVRFAYRYRFEDNTYSIFSPFTQIAFIPKQDGYFMFVDPNNATNNGSQAKNDQDEAYRSTIVYFMENKVNSIDLKIPLPFNNYDIQDALKIKEIDILYKESDGIAVRVVETLPVNKITNQSCVCEVDGAQTPGAAGNPIAIKNIQGGITIGRGAFGPGISGSVTSFTPTDPSNPVSGTITVSSTVAQLDDNSPIIIGDIRNFNYEYKSTKPTKTLPESNLIRVYDKIPVRAQAQEIAGNRVIYGNFQNKITPPDFLNYNVASTEKAEFNIQDATFTYSAGAATYAAGDPINVSIILKTNGSDGLWTGYYVTCNDYGVNIPVDTQVTSATSNVTGASTITLSNTVTFPGGTVIVIAEPGASTEDSVTKIEYPNSSVKTNRNYQVGFVLSDRYGRQSSVILSNNETSIIVNGVEYAGSTLFSPYIDRNVDQTSWPGNSLKVLMNQPIPNNNLYNSDITSVDYNPLGWYSYKIVVKQTEQDYYNVYLPGIMASYPNDATLEIGQTSHAVLINDNINKVPRDLTEVGPDQKQFRSSVQLIGRVQNTAPLSIVSGNTNSQYYPQRTTDTVSVISTVNDLFDFNPIEPPLLNLFPQFYSLESNPLIARLSTEFKIGQLPNANYLPAGGESVLNSGTPPTPSSTLIITSVSADPNILSTSGSLVNYLVTGVGVPSETYVSSNTAVGGGAALPGEMNIVLKDSGGLAVVVNLAANTKISLTPTEGNASVPNFKLTRPGIQYLAVCETQPVESAIDIFWETSTSGLISDLNQAVLNNQSQPAGSNISWNPDFNEGLAEDGFILAAPFSVVDNFGQIIALSAGDTLELAAVNGGPPITNGLGESVSGSGFVSTTQVRDYFRLVDLGTAPSGFGPWQIQTTSASDPTAANYVPSASNYFDNVYYFYDSQAALRQFTFNFRIVIDNQENFVTRVANLGNVVPEFFTVEALNVNTPAVTYGPGVGTVVPSPVEIQSNKGTRDISIININNGSSSFTDPNPNGGRALSTRDLRIVDQNYNDFGIWSQNIDSPNGPPAEVVIFGDSAPIFSLQPITPITSNGNIQVKLINLVTVLGAGALSLMASSVYYITLALQDAGGTIIFQQIKVDMRVQLSNNNFWNKIQTVDAYGFQAENYNGSPPQFLESGAGAPAVNSSVPSGCGAANFCQPPGGDTRWWCYPSTIFEINENDIGASADTYGWYVYALGYFDNNPGDSGLCCDTNDSFGIAGSTSLVEYSSADITNSITIPMNTPITAGEHLVQRQPTFLNKRGFSSATINQINSWGYPPLLHGRIAVTGYEILASGEAAWTYEVLDGDSDKAITGCMKLFRDFGGSYDFNTGVSTYGFGWNCGGANGGHFQNSQAQQEQIVLNGTPNVRTARISSTFVDSLGNKKFTYVPRGTASTGFGTSRDEPNTGGQADLDPNWDFNTQGPQIIYTYAGPQNFQTSPWFFVPTNGTTTTMDPILKIWSMYTYSGWVGCKWRSSGGIRTSSGFRDRKYWEIWAQRWKPNVPFVNPPETLDSFDLEQGIQRNLNDENPPCEAHAQHMAQDSRPINAGNYQYSII